MKIDLALHRDQRRLAVAKLASLPEDNPLRDRYNDWIARLDEIIFGSIPMPTQTEDSKAPMPTSPLDGVRVPDAPTSHTDVRVMKAKTLTSPLGPIRPIKKKSAQQSASAGEPANGPLTIKKEGGGSDKRNPTVELGPQNMALKERFLSENTLLRSMLERFP
ncbi:hypothetical protein [Rhizobium leguminosarum]|uniref:hypothetical protein n=1 Tax=Rhizobium leguminosarum TaxID=384 RepID=UPI00143F0B06|nr:hypothetical protein [Rhizobium leguminosarum]NKL23665.1 hypothetical protein [Rhizobium leguminosarum bv. viciae]